MHVLPFITVAEVNAASNENAVRILLHAILDMLLNISDIYTSGELVIVPEIKIHFIFESEALYNEVNTCKTSEILSSKC